MAESSSVRSCVEYLYDCDESLFKCCNCQDLMSDPVLLKCLHGCCQSCAFKASSSTAGQQTLKSSSFVKCAICCEETEHVAATPNGLLGNYRRLSALMSESVCCNKCDVHDVAAVFWCADCCLGLCESCYTWHNRFLRRHRSAELEVARAWSVRQLVPAGQCDSHKRQIEKLCFTCRVPKCQQCCESCRAEKHELHPLTHDETRRQLTAALKAIGASRERLGLAVSDLQRKCQDTRSRLQGDGKNDGHQILLQHERSLKDAIFDVFETSYGKTYNNEDKIRKMCTTFRGRRIKLRETVNLATGSITVLLPMPLVWLRLLRASKLQKESVSRCMAALGESLNYHRQNYSQENGALIIDGSSPLTSDIVLRTFLGTTEHRRAAPRAPLQFDQTTVLFRTPYVCWDVAVTRDGLVLLAAAAHGLLVYSDRGKQLSIWKPKKIRNGRDGVSCVTTLSDGRAAVALALTRVVVLLRRIETGDSWQEDGRVVVLQSPPWRLAAHDDLLAVSELRLEAQQQLWVAGRQVKLQRLSSRQLLYTHNRDYDIARIALTAMCLVTSSYNPVKRNSRVWTCVVDAFSHSGQFLWSHKTSAEEWLGGLCASSDTLSPVYMVAARQNGSSRVKAIGGADGKDKKDVVSNGSHMRQLPWHLSLARGQQRTVLAAVSRERIAGTDQYTQAKTVTLYFTKG